MHSKVSSILNLELMPPADLGRFVMSYVEVSTLLNLHVVESSTSLICLIRLFVADKSSDSSEFPFITSSLNDLDAHDFAALSKKLSKELFVVVGGKVLNEEIALHLRVLGANLVAKNLSLTLICWGGWLHVKLVTFEFLVLKLLDSLECGLTAM